MISIRLSTQIVDLLPNLRLGCLQGKVQINLESSDLWAEIDPKIADFAAGMQIPDIAKRSAIASTRRAYKLTGKDPSRYRPSAEALTRRVVNGKGLYQVNNVVDLLNWVSVSSGFSIGGWDAGAIQGTAELGIASEGEPYEAIGRGELNIAGLPVFRDDLGAFGTPTSDSVRTQVTASTQDFLMIFYDFESDPGLVPAMEKAQTLLKQYAGASQLESQYHS